MEKIVESINNLAFDAKIRAQSSLSILGHVDGMINEFKARTSNDKSSILLDVFGLLQSLFVGIDALYQLSFSATKYKYHININANNNLRMLKYLRNDVVGHPTNRNYEDGSYGFSEILEKEITRNSMSYVTYIIKDKEIIKDKTTIEFKRVLDAYTKEKHNLMSDLNNYLSRNKIKLESIGYLVNMFEKGIKNTFELKDIVKLEFLIKDEQNIAKEANNRFVWRLELLKKLYHLEDQKYVEYIKYLRLKEILNIYKMTLDISNKKAKMPTLKLPKILADIKTIVKQNKSINELIKHLNESLHPMFKYDLSHLIDQINDEEIKEFLKWFENLEDNDISYVVGKSLKDLSK